MPRPISPTVGRIRSAMWIGLKVSLVVGTLLNAINQHEVLVHAPHLASIPMLALNYVIPFSVSAYSAWSAGAKRCPQCDGELSTPRSH